MTAYEDRFNIVTLKRRRPLPGYVTWQAVFRPSAGLGINDKDLFYRLGMAVFCFKNRAFHHFRNIGKPDLPLEESRHRYFVRGIQGDGLGTPCLGGLIG